MTIFSLFANPVRMMLISFTFLSFYTVYLGIFDFNGKKIHRLWPTLLLGCLWFFCGLWEFYSAKMGYNIRIDLVFLLPFMYGLGFIIFITVIVPGVFVISTGIILLLVGIGIHMVQNRKPSGS